MLNTKALFTKIIDTLKTRATIVNGSVITKTVPTGTTSNIMQMVLPKGNWLITGDYVYSASFTGVTGYFLYIGSDIVAERSAASYGGGGSLASIVRLTASTTVYLAAYQQSGSNKTVSTCHLMATRLS